MPRKSLSKENIYFVYNQNLSWNGLIRLISSLANYKEVLGHIWV